MAKATCFSREQLREYLLGDLPDDASDNVALHVETCVDCEATVSELDCDSDTFIESLRKPVPQEEPVSVYRLAAQHAKSYWRNPVEESSCDESETDGNARLRDYELLEPLARGGMGTVYRARHVRLNRQVALKVLPGRWLRDPVIVARFEREMQAVGSLRHPAIVQATDGGDANGVHFLAMELIDGFDGGALVQFTGPLSVANACEIARQAAVGMAYVHEQGIVHRDLKPSNIMVTKVGEVKVLDLGLARIVGAQLAEDELTTVGQLMGTIDFMAPEQLENSHEVDERADIYSLGATLYKLLTGVSPHSVEEREPMMAKLRRIAGDPPMPLSERRSDLPSEVCDLVNRMLSHDANDRPTSMNEVVASLESLAESSDLAQQVKIATKARKLSERNGRSSDKSHALPASALSELQPKVERSSNGTGNHVNWIVWVATALLLVAAAMGVVITVQTNAGQLVIETSSPDAEVRVLKAGKPYRQLSITKEAESLRLGAGEYEIEIVGAADGLVIENGKYTLKRGDTWLAKIVHRQTLNEVSESTDPLATTWNATARHTSPTYEGKTLDQWLVLLETERSPNQFIDACMALEKLAIGAETERVVTALLSAAKFHNRDEVTVHGTKGAHRLWKFAEDLLARRDQSVVVTSLVNELDRGEETHAELVLEYLKYVGQDVRPAVTEPLIAHLENLAIDPKSEHRQDSLELLQSLASKEVATRNLIRTLSDQDVKLQLFAARTLIEMQSNTPLVVSTLRTIVRSGELSHRAEAAWLLGDLGVAGSAALPDLLAILQEDDDLVTLAAVYDTPGYVFNGTLRSDWVSVKDAAIRGLTEFGDESTAPALIAEWERRALADPRQAEAIRFAIEEKGFNVLNDSNEEWVAEAIQQLIGAWPELSKDRQFGTQTIWYSNGMNLEKAYETGFSNSNGTLPEALDAAKKLMDRANDSEKVQARGYIMSVDRVPSLIEVGFEVQLAELLAGEDDPSLVLHAALRRWHFYAANGNRTWSPKASAKATQAYHDCALRIARQVSDWQTMAYPRLMQLIKDHNWVASVILVDMIDELDEEEQVTAIVGVFTHSLRSGSTNFATTIPEISTWLSEKSHSEAIHRKLEKLSGDDWEHLVVGLVRSNLADKVSLDIVKTRFSNDSIRRSSIFSALLYGTQVTAEGAELLLDLLRDPALDSLVPQGSKTVSTRAQLYLPRLEGIEQTVRPHFLPFLRELAKSGSNGEDEMAQHILDKWK